MPPTSGTGWSPSPPLLPVTWIALAGAPGHLGMARAPGLGAARGAAAALHADVRCLRHVHHCDVLVTLLPDQEAERLGVVGLREAVSVHDIEHLHLPIEDFGVPAPDALERVLDVVDEVRHRLRDGRTVVLHCRAGWGRSGTIAAIVVASLWALPEEAVGRVRESQPNAVETLDQERYVVETSYAWFRREAARAARRRPRSLTRG
jgi:protein-tyrosine phosphatase